jgi:hypothetical protein
VTQQHLAGQLPDHDGCVVRIDADWEQYSRSIPTLQTGQHRVARQRRAT